MQKQESQTKYRLDFKFYSLKKQTIKTFLCIFFWNELCWDLVSLHLTKKVGPLPEDIEGSHQNYHKSYCRDCDSSRSVAKILVAIADGFPDAKEAILVVALIRDALVAVLHGAAEAPSH